jgi:hypothetical protein
MAANGRQNFVGVACRAALCILALAVTCSCAARKGLSGRTLRIGFADSAPYYTVSPDGSPQGLAVDLIREAARRQKIALQWIDARPWFTLVDKAGFAPEYLLSHNFIDLWPVAGIARQRLALAHIGPPWLQNSFFLVSRKAAPLITPAQAEDKRIAHMSGPLSTETCRGIYGKCSQVYTRGRGGHPGVPRSGGRTFRRDPVFGGG